ncbi:FAD-binding oxidoreductase [Phenylobacterium sp. LH3H17]|uniref:FAD-dependent oxidoreductase n=1 Tax=Phenylobacterium sp. LH3H17 TaxID=2903901 RepID=UPI0020CA0AFE|nr:FAD-dependent oxidoreductase [Phenylobacterium sp. LH3H17]UTP38024.1 FAD-binding oxidoreductase [Phenylobacterium sp. LH3H17]
MRAVRGRIAILGAGIMGASLAITMSRRGYAVSLFDKENEPVACASRWNEGKIHLGYLYGADPSLLTAKHLVSGGLQFGTLVSELIGNNLVEHTTFADDIYLVHRDSIIGAEALGRTFERVDALLHDHADASNYLVDVSAARSRRLSKQELADVTDSEQIVGGFKVPERSVNTRWIADRLCEVLKGEPNITLRMASKILSARPVDEIDGRWRVAVEGEESDAFDVVVNCLWEGRLAVDRTAGLEPTPGWSHRYRLCLFGRTRRPVDVGCAVVALGPFGDIKNYDGRNFYISWYPAGLLAESSELSIATPAAMDASGRQQIIDDVRARITQLVPNVSRMFDEAEELQLRGGFVFAQGRGSLSDPKATIHRRDQFGINRRGSYLSIDTGKYSTAPWLAEKLTRQICRIE